MEGSEHVPQQVGTGLGEVFFEEAGRVDTGRDGLEMDLAVLSKDHAVTVASCGDTLTEIRYTTLKDATTRLLQPPVFSSVSESVWEKGLPYTCKSVVCSYFSVFPDSVKVTLNACVSSVLSMNWVSATPWLCL